MLRILILTDSFLPSLGGVERHTYTLSRYLSKLSHEVHIVTSPSKNPVLDFQLDNDLETLYKIKVFRVLPTATRLPIYSTAKYLFYCYNLVKYINRHENNYDIIHYHGTHQLFLRFVKNKKPIITSIHGIFPACILQSLKPCEKLSTAKCVLCDLRNNPEHIFFLPATTFYYSFYYRFMRESLRSVNKVICVSEYVKKYIEKHLNLSNSNLVTIHNFIDIEEINQTLSSMIDFDIRMHLNIANDAKIITYFGRLSFEKGVDLLVKAFAKIHEKVGGNVYLLIGGHGPQKAQLESMTKTIRNIIFTGYVPRKIQLAIMAQSNVFVHPARYPDACPTTILEAMALGLPIIASKVGGIPELVAEGKSGILINPNNVHELSDAMLELLSSNEERIRDISLFNKRVAHRFDIEYIGDKIVQIYKKAL